MSSSRHSSSKFSKYSTSSTSIFSDVDRALTHIEGSLKMPSMPVAPVHRSSDLRRLKQSYRTQNAIYLKQRAKILGQLQKLSVQRSKVVALKQAVDASKMYIKQAKEAELFSQQAKKSVYRAFRKAEQKSNAVLFESESDSESDCDEPSMCTAPPAYGHPSPQQRKHIPLSVSTGAAAEYYNRGGEFKFDANATRLSPRSDGHRSDGNMMVVDGVSHNSDLEVEVDSASVSSSGSSKRYREAEPEKKPVKRVALHSDDDESSDLNGSLLDGIDGLGVSSPNDEKEDYPDFTAADL